MLVQAVENNPYVSGDNINWWGFIENSMLLLNTQKVNLLFVYLYINSIVNHGDSNKKRKVIKSLIIWDLYDSK